MTPEETLKICRYVKACLPQQAIDEYTPLAWHDHLESYTYDDARAAAKDLCGRQAWVQIPELVAGIKRIRAKRIAEAGPLTPPPNLTPVETCRWLAGARSAVGDGMSADEVTTTHGGALRPRDLSELRALPPMSDRDDAQRRRIEALDNHPDPRHVWGSTDLEDT